MKLAFACPTTGEPHEMACELNSHDLREMRRQTFRIACPSCGKYHAFEWPDAADSSPDDVAVLEAAETN